MSGSVHVTVRGEVANLGYTIFPVLLFVQNQNLGWGPEPRPTQPKADPANLPPIQKTLRLCGRICGRISRLASSKTVRIKVQSRAHSLYKQSARFMQTVRIVLIISADDLQITCARNKSIVRTISNSLTRAPRNSLAHCSHRAASCVSGAT